jgi:hypothetical protein
MAPWLEAAVEAYENGVNDGRAGRESNLDRMVGHPASYFRGYRHGLNALQNEESYSRGQRDLLDETGHTEMEE